MKCKCCGHNFLQENAIVCPSCGAANFVHDLVSPSDIEVHNLAVQRVGDFEQSAFVIENKVLLEYRGTQTQVRIPAGVEIIADLCFSNSLTPVESVVIPSSVMYINSHSRSDFGENANNNGAFMFCSALKTVRFEEGSQLKEIGYRAFYKCKKLENVQGLEGLRNVKIQGHAFGDCPRRVLNQIRANRMLDFSDKWESVT